MMWEVFSLSPGCFVSSWQSQIEWGGPTFPLLTFLRAQCRGAVLLPEPLLSEVQEEPPDRQRFGTLRREQETPVLKSPSILILVHFFNLKKTQLDFESLDLHGYLGLLSLSQHPGEVNNIEQIRPWRLTGELGRPASPEPCLTRVYAKSIGCLVPEWIACQPFASHFPITHQCPLCPLISVLQDSGPLYWEWLREYQLP